MWANGGWTTGGRGGPQRTRRLAAVSDALPLADDALAAVPALLDAAAAADGSRAVSEAGELALRHRRTGVHHLGVLHEGALVAYAQVGPDDGAAGVEAVVHPAHRRTGLGSALARAVLASVPAGTEVLAWAHGDHPGARALAARLGARRVRELRRMHRPLTAADAALPDPATGVRLRTFVVGQDEPAWLRVNAAAFAHHPEQGRTTLEDLREREQEPWFDPAGFLLAEDEQDGALLGFHWTKVHPAAAGEPAAGEVYVLGVDPSAQGRRLGATLLQAGLAHLAAARDPQGEPLGTVLLYVEADNAPAVRLYERQGFEVAHVDVRYALTTT